MRIWMLGIVLFMSVAGFLGWQAVVGRIMLIREYRRTSLEHRFICESLLTKESFLEVCPSARHLERLRVMPISVRFPHVNKCTISVTAPGERPATLIVAIDQFPTVEQARERYQLRRHDAVIVDEDVLGILGTHSTIDGILNGRALMLLRDRVVADIAPSGGGLCPKEELMELGRLLAQRLVLFLPQEE